MPFSTPLEPPARLAALDAAATVAMSASSGTTLDPVFRAQQLFRRHEYDDCVALCTELLAANPYDQAVWYLKCRSLTLLTWVDDTDFEEEGVADVLLDENATASLPRPGTSLNRPMTQANVGVPGQGMRPVSASGRPLSGFARPGTGSARPDSGAGLAGAMAGARPGTSRPVTALGRLVRLGTASMLSESGGPFIRVDRLDLKKYASRPELAKVLFDYILYHGTPHTPRASNSRPPAAAHNAALAAALIAAPAAAHNAAPAAALNAAPAALLTRRALEPSPVAHRPQPTQGARARQLCHTGGAV